MSKQNKKTHYIFLLVYILTAAAVAFGLSGKIKITNILASAAFILFMGKIATYIPVPGIKKRNKNAVQSEDEDLTPWQGGYYKNPRIKDG